ncbi:hypothetical protein BST23_00530 [Mycolicibacterium elephantis]|uniref:DUF1918 domain-containing protein n=1 Tax=Mycolicibacterium elephantis TaxID=81858 RepID=A0A1X0D9V1_9MYCO|nr:hypothetical protein [Mycolicibacterium elephantis]ORA69185.1 hypothetical protein BST23_00530 [Mycolicibacterium elephantis]
MKATYYPPKTRVVVLAHAPLPHAGQRGTVVSTRNDAGEMWHRVRFGDGATAEYLAEELAGAESTSMNNQIPQEHRP